MLGEAQYVSICNQMKDSARAIGFRAGWREVRDRFPDDFRVYMDGVIGEAADNKNQNGTKTA